MLVHRSRVVNLGSNGLRAISLSCVLGVTSPLICAQLLSRSTAADDRRGSVDAPRHKIREAVHDIDPLIKRVRSRREIGFVIDITLFFMELYRSI
jgi:hypothetical protein